MQRISLLTILAIAIVGTTAVFVGRHEGNGIKGHLMLGANKCTWGPGYWCKNVSTTHECGAIQHCVKKDWKTKTLPEDRSAPCDLCVNTLTKLETILKANLTADVIEGVFDEICTSVAIPAKLCEKYLDPYVLEIREAILEHIKPQVTCHVMHFCNNEEGVGKTFQRLAVSMADTETAPTLSQAALAAVMPLGPVIMTGDSPAVYGGDKSAVAPLTCSDGQVFWCESLENAKKCNAVEHCKQVVWAHQKNSPVSSKEELEESTNVLESYFTRVPLDSEQCSKGQTFWCSNLASAASCGATQHCIQAVWSHMKVKDDKDDGVCKICKDMVAQARDQLRSNETQTDLKAVFEGSCNLMPVKVVREGCDKLVDDFVPELVEVLSSQMNPDVVCSVAGLCNNAMVDELLRNAKSSSTKTSSVSIETTKVSQDDSDCKNCADFADLLTTKFNAATPEAIMKMFRNFCSEFSSLSDVCLKIIEARGPLMYDNLNTYFTTGMVASRHFPLSVLNMCRVNKMCTNQTIPSSAAPMSVEVFHKSESGVLSHESSTSLSSGDDLPCSLCDQLVKHLKDILVANTTQAEFKQVLEGICHQTGAFSAQCKDMVEQYYSIIYTFLTTELNPNVICVDVGLCPKKPTVVFNNMDILSAMNVPVVPMHIEPIPHLLFHVHKGEDSESSEEIHKKLAEPVAPGVMIESSTKPACTICEYVLHFVQEQVADMKNEKKILTAMDNACDQMPGEFATECHQFVQEYGPAFVALIIQQIDPSQVCPKLKVCSHTAKSPMNFAENEQSKGACPLCLLAVQALDESVLNNRTEENIKHNLDKICTSLPKHLASDCDRFINTYYDDLIDMLTAEAKPQEICVYMKLCLPPKRIVPEIVVDTSSGTGSLSKDSQTCFLCEFVMTNLDKIIRDKKTEEEIKHAVHSVCRVMPKSIKQECDDFVNQYADLIIQLLSQSLSPKQICEALNACKPDHMKVAVSQCAVCEEAMSHLDDALLDPEVKNNDIKAAVDKVCYHVDKSEFDDCNKFILKYGTKILTIVDSTESYQICTKIKVCPDVKGRLPAFEEDKTSPVKKTYKETGTQTENQGHSAAAVVNEEIEVIDSDTCKSVLGFSLCQSQVVFVLMGILMCVCVVLILAVARTVRRNRTARGVASPPYEKLYQPTTIPTHMADDFTATIVR